MNSVILIGVFLFYLILNFKVRLDSVGRCVVGGKLVEVGFMLFIGCSRFISI